MLRAQTHGAEPEPAVLPCTARNGRRGLRSAPTWRRRRRLLLVSLLGDGCGGDCLAVGGHDGGRGAARTRLEVFPGAELGRFLREKY